MESSTSISESIQQSFNTMVSILTNVAYGIIIILMHPGVYITLIVIITYYTLRRIYRREPNIIKKAIFLNKHNNDKGAYGEWLTEYALGNNHLKGYSKLLHNIYIPYANKTSEIDILLIHEKGVYVIESKNYSGWIFGSEKDLNWTQCLGNKSKNKFYNPIRQNRTHIKALSQYLNTELENVKSLIVFSNRCELKKVPENTEEFLITKRQFIFKKVRQELEERETIYSKEQINEIYSKLLELTNTSEEVKQKHIEEIKSTHNK